MTRAATEAAGRRTVAGRLATARARRWRGRARAGVTLGGASYPLTEESSPGGSLRLGAVRWRKSRSMHSLALAAASSAGPAAASGLGGTLSQR
jgi:hypothetical protein